ncbi:hypothetical protein OS493_031313 [Desmophyllum pertusum]|uniref:Uncharacterized protein n=1 Tax=Desmophyllum pertusum TaxID=174260 RepID=A0A9W9YW52_9CNID|nr:hypothetical protein OS493_031313 [Desmophyllum pertusum]
MALVPTLSQPMGICVENGRNIFVTDAHVEAVKSLSLITDAGCAVKFLENLGKLLPGLLSAPEAQANSYVNSARSTVQSVQTLLDTNKQTNGPEGTIASKTVRSVDMINQGLARLQRNITKMKPELTVNQKPSLL